MKLLIKTHSFIDVITNSSTELFICDTSKTLEEVKQIIQDQWNLFVLLQKNMHDIPYQLSDMKNELDVFEILEVKQIDDTFIEKAKKHKEKWGFDLYDGYAIELNKGDIWVEGITDNSIPFEFFDIIENTFNARRIHLG